MTESERCAKLFEELGFTSLEAGIYVFLLQHSPATGYKVAKGIGRSFTNTYKALESLRETGAVLVDDGRSRLCRAIPVEELFALMETRFRDRRRRAIEATARLPQAAADTRIYQIHSVEQVYERCRRILEESEERVLLELFPEPLEALRSAVEAAAKRGVDVTVRVYAPATIRGVRIIQSPIGEETMESFRSQWLSVFVDGRQYLLGLLATGGGEVYQAIWSSSPILSWAFYGYVNSDLHHYAFRPALESAASLEEARREYERIQEFFPIGGDLGFRDLRDRIETDWRTAEPTPNEGD